MTGRRTQLSLTTGVTTAPPFRAPTVVRLFRVAPRFDERQDYGAPLSAKPVVTPVVSSNPQKSAVSPPLTTRLLSKSQKKNSRKKRSLKEYARASVVRSQHSSKVARATPRSRTLLTTIAGRRPNHANIAAGEPRP